MLPEPTEGRSSIGFRHPEGPPKKDRKDMMMVRRQMRVAMITTSRRELEGMREEMDIVECESPETSGGLPVPYFHGEKQDIMEGARARAERAEITNLQDEAQVFEKDPTCVMMTGWLSRCLGAIKALWVLSWFGRGAAAFAFAAIGLGNSALPLAARS